MLAYFQILSCLRENGTDRGSSKVMLKGIIHTNISVFIEGVIERAVEC
jgi:hypothetical protein